MSESERAQLVAEARSWIGTPYAVGGRVKGGGCDCGTLLLCALQARGMARGEELGVYSVDCWQHWSDEQYLFRMLRHFQELAETVAVRSVSAAPGTLLLCRTSHARVYNHGGIVTAWPFAVHSIRPRVEEVDVTRDPLWAHRQLAVFDPFTKPEAVTA